MENTFWRDAAKGGIIVGAIVVAVSYIKTWLAMAGSGMVMLFSLLEIIAVAYVLYKMCKQRSMLYDAAAGYSVGQNMAYVTAVMLFSGIIYGVGYYFLVNHVAAAFYEETFAASFETMYKMVGNVSDAAFDMAMSLVRNPFYWLFYGIMAMIIYGGIIGLFVSAFVKRKPDIFAGNNTQNEG